MNIVILGGDGYLGWPTAMYFSKKGYHVTVVDNYFKRNSCMELNVSMLYPVPSLIDRAKLWHQLTGYEIKVVIGDLNDPGVMRGLFNGHIEYDWAINTSFSGAPDAVIHYAEQPSAPYSQLDYKHANTTLINNLSVTNNLMFAVRDLSRDTHIIKLGTMGEYGTPNIDIEEGWLDIEHKGRKDTFLFPRQASSIYHTTKIMDTDLLWFGTRMWDLKVTDLMQGPVYGIETDESILHDHLKTSFYYDEIYGTVLNRFIVQAVADYPLSIYGEGGQTRGYLDIRDTLQCVGIALDNSSSPGKLSIYNQIMETFSVEELASKIKNVGNQLGYDVKIQHIGNPRCEAESHYYNPVYNKLLDYGVKPHYLTEESLISMFQVIEKYKKRIRKEIIFRGVKW